MLKLLTDQTDLENASPTIAVRWCADRETLEELKQNNTTNPHILISIVHIEGMGTTKYGVETDRKLIPLEEMMTYISFQKPGVNYIYATIVWDYEGSIKNLKNKFLNKESRNKWVYYILKNDGMDFNPGYSTQNYTGIASLTIKIDENFFAKPSFDKKWVEYFPTFLLGYQSDNQCSYRRRRIFAYTIQPFLLLLSFISRLLSALTLSLMGKRDVNYNAVYNLMGTDLNDVWRNVGESIFEYKNIDNEQPWFFPFLMPLWYVIASIIGLLSYILGKEIKLTVLWQAPLLLLVSFATIVTIFYIFVFANRFLFSPIGKFIAFLFLKIPVIKIPVNEKKDEWKKAQQEMENKISQQYEKWVTITCEPNSELKPISVSSLPKNKQTIHLRYMDFKAKVCKPFAK